MIALAKDFAFFCCIVPSVTGIVVVASILLI
jgi:hypothetical protein